MNDSGRPRWLSTALLVGTFYCAIGIGFGALAAAAATRQMGTFWRLGAWVVCAVAFAAHIAHECFRRRNTARPAAWHAAVAAALGAFGLALAANIHDIGAAAGYRPRMLVALAAWPLLTGVPAFVVALAVAAGLGAMRRRGLS